MTSKAMGRHIHKKRHLVLVQVFFPVTWLFTEGSVLQIEYI